MGVIDIGAQVTKALHRLDFDIAARLRSIQDKTPQDIASDTQLRDRKDFLASSLGAAEFPRKVYERIILGNELQPISYLERGAVAAQAIARIQIGTLSGAGGLGTGFLIAPQVLITNNHVLPDAATATASFAQFEYQLDLADREIGPVTFSLEPGQLFFTSPKLDFTVVGVAARGRDSGLLLHSFGHLPLLETLGKVSDGEWLTIVQHPAGERKQLCVRENRLIGRTEDALWYSTDTLAGSSGSPVFNNDWIVVALHHSGVPEERDGRIQTVDGRDYDPATMGEHRIKWRANEGIRASRIVQALKAAHPDHPLLRSMFAATPATARITRRLPSQEAAARFIPPLTEQRPMSDKSAFGGSFDIRLRVTADGHAFVIEDAGGLTETAITVLEKSRSRTADFDVPFNDKYDGRKGYRADFLGAGKEVPLPLLGPDLAAEAAPLLRPEPKNKYVLNYHNFSVVMHAQRRLAIYSAANVRFSQRFEMSRTTDVWRRDPRIAAKHQLENWYYARNQFDRGHLTRREDLEYGLQPIEALTSAADTCHWTNCAPQHARFNQNKQTWHGIERYLLEQSILLGNVDAQVITGPILDEGDPEYQNIQYPLQYWKVVAALDSTGNIFATAYLASQEEAIGQFGIEAVPPFGAYKTYQVKISEIERLTGLSFVAGADGKTALSARDPLAARRSSRRRSREIRRDESQATAAVIGRGYVEITTLDDIVT